jgi:hypothetical protein
MRAGLAALIAIREGEVSEWLRLGQGGHQTNKHQTGR